MALGGNENGSVSNTVEQPQKSRELSGYFPKRRPNRTITMVLRLRRSGELRITGDCCIAAHPLDRDHGFDHDAVGRGCHGHAATQRHHPLPHPGEPQAELVIDRQTATIVLDAHQRGSPLDTAGPADRLDAHLDMRGPGMAEGVGQRLLNRAVDGEIRGLAIVAKRWGDRRLDHRIGMHLPPQPQQRRERLMQAELGQSHRPQSLQHTPIGLLQRVDLFQHGAAVLAQHVGLRRLAVRHSHQRGHMGSQREQIGPELVVQFPRDFLALRVLERDHPLRQMGLFRDRIAEGSGEMVQLAADRGEFGRPSGLDPRVVAASLDTRHRPRQRIERRERAADDRHGDQEQDNGDRRADFHLRHDAIPDLRHLVAGMRGDHKGAQRLSVDGDGNADRRLLRMDQRHEPGRWRIGVVTRAGRRLAIHFAVRCDRPPLARDADMAQPLQVLRNAGQPHLRILRVAQADD